MSTEVIKWPPIIVGNKCRHLHFWRPPETQTHTIPTVLSKYWLIINCSHVGLCWGRQWNAELGKSEWEVINKEKVALCTGSWACMSAAFRSRKQSLYIHLWWVIHGKPSGKKKKKKQRTGTLISENIRTSLGRFMDPTMDRYQGRSHEEDENVFGGLDRERGLGSGWDSSVPVGIPNTDVRISMWFGLEGWCQGRPQHRWLSCDLRLRPVFIVSVNFFLSYFSSLFSAWECLSICAICRILKKPFIKQSLIH